MTELVALTEVKEHLHTLPTRIVGVVSLGVWVGATSALTVAQLWFGDATDLREADLGFLPPPLLSPWRIASLVADFGIVSDVIIATVNVDHIFHSTLDEE